MFDIEIHIHQGADGLGGVGDVGISAARPGLLMVMGLPCYLLTLAPAPPMMASTSLTLAMEVSPGVVIASAPCAAP